METSKWRSSLIVWFSWSYSYLFLLSRGISTMTFTVSMRTLLINRACVVLRSSANRTHRRPRPHSTSGDPDVDFAVAKPGLRQKRRVAWNELALSGVGRAHV